MVVRSTREGRRASITKEEDGKRARETESASAGLFPDCGGRKGRTRRRTRRKKRTNNADVTVLVVLVVLASEVRLASPWSTDEDDSVLGLLAKLVRLPEVETGVCRTEQRNWQK
jgi:hypothetical protein